MKETIIYSAVIAKEARKRIVEPYRGPDHPPVMPVEIELAKIRAELHDIQERRRVGT